ncbi:ABC transporter ATP-binding protein [Marinilabiliaceae bacterium ANBcel2]|nr:ABC transporter ATP-binding protein [Marinilabiliaceae bacterium ANBcel2]
MSLIKSLLRKNIITGTVIRIREVLPNRHKKRSVKMMLLLLLNSLFEMIGLAAFLPLFSVILQPGVIESHKIISTIYQKGGFISEEQFIITLALLIVVVVVIKNIASLLIKREQAKFSLSLYQYFSNRLHQLYYSKGFPFFKKTNSNVILRNINTIPQKFANQLVLPTFSFFNETFVLILLLTGLFLYDPLAIILLTCTILPVFITFYNWVKNRSVRIERETNKITPKLTKSIFQSVHGYPDVEITNTQKRFRKRIAKYIGRLVQLSVKRQVYNQAPTKVIETGMVLSIFVMTAYGLYALPDRSGLAALLGLYALAAYRVLPSANRLMIALMSVKGFQYTLDIISQVKNFEPEETKERGISFKESIELKNISFKFPDSNSHLLNNVNIDIKRGESLGIIGESGSGKTTLMNIMLGFWQPSSGEILIDKTPLTRERINAWRDRIGYVQQEVYITDSSLAENVAFGLKPEEIDHKQLKKVLKQASLWKFTQSLPNKTETRIGERGTKLSGGQRQRVGIARALYSGADILFFDEATSALDSATEEDITESIKELSHGDLTLIIIAHRKTTLKYCSRIIKIVNGDIKGEVKYKDIE